MREAKWRRSRGRRAREGRGTAGGGTFASPAAVLVSLTLPIPTPLPTTDRTLTLDLPVDATVETVLAAVEARQGEFYEWGAERVRGSTDDPRAPAAQKILERSEATFPGPALPYARPGWVLELRRRTRA